LSTIDTSTTQSEPPEVELVLEVELLVEVEVEVLSDDVVVVLDEFDPPAPPVPDWPGEDEHEHATPAPTTARRNGHRHPLDLLLIEIVLLRTKDVTRGHHPGKILRGPAASEPTSDSAECYARLNCSRVMSNKGGPTLITLSKRTGFGNLAFRRRPKPNLSLMQLLATEMLSAVPLAA
jgi:hypothetical protein